MDYEEQTQKYAARSGSPLRDEKLVWQETPEKRMPKSRAEAEPQEPW